MGHLMILLALVACASAHGHYYSTIQNPSPFAQPTRYGGFPLVYGHKIKHQIPAYLPLSPTFQVEIMKPMAQLEEQKSVKLFIIPQNALHVFPHVQRVRFQAPVTQFPELAQFMGDPAHLPAIEIPLQSPMVVGSVESQVLAPAGFTVLFKGPYGAPLQFPINTGALIAPVPAGTIISAETPVVLNTIYAVPNLPALPSYYPLLVDLPQSIVGPTKETTVKPLPQRVTTAVIPISTSLATSTGIPPSTTIGGYPSSEVTPPAVFQQDIQIDNELTGQDPIIIGYQPSDIVSGTTSTNNRKPFSNSKESPYLQELREQSIQTLEAQITDLQRRLQQIRSN